MRPHTVSTTILLATLAGCAKEGPKPADTTTTAATASPPAAATAASVAATPLAPGEARLAVDGGRIWYRVVGSGTATPAILLHGGPGYASFYMRSLEAIGADRPVVRYDQLGAGKSDRITDTAMFNIAHFVRELDSLRSHLGYDKVHIVGHSWGTILGFEYYRAHPEHVASLTLMSPALDIPAWERNAKRLVKTLSDSSQKAIATREAEKKFAAPDYQAALGEFYGKYVWLRPVQAELDSTMAGVNEAIYNYMQGPSEFTITGTLKQYDATPMLKTVKVPVLFTVGEFDEADPPTVKRHAAMTPGAKVAVIPNAAHLVECDNPDETNRVVREFLKSVDTAKTRQ
jgi:proline iminopeptidase